MPRPRLYKTAAEKKEANRAKSKRSYLRHKEAIALRRKTNRDKQQQKTTSQLTDAKSQSTKCSQRHSHLDHYLRQARRIGHKLDKHTGGEPMRYIEKVYSAYEACFMGGETKPKILDDEIIKMNKLQHAIKRCGRKILQEAGVGKEWNEVEDIRMQVHIVVSHLEEMLCEAMVDPKELIDAHNSHSLSYQRQ